MRRLDAVFRPVRDSRQPSAGTRIARRDRASVVLCGPREERGSPLADATEQQAEPGLRPIVDYLELPTDDLAHAVRRVSLLASDRFGRAVRLCFSDGKLELFSKTEVGEGQETLEVDYKGEELTIGFNARYLLDYLNVVGNLKMV